MYGMTEIEKLGQKVDDMVGKFGPMTKSKMYELKSALCGMFSNYDLIIYKATSLRNGTGQLGMGEVTPELVALMDEVIAFCQARIEAAKNE